jgi:hypothetical protein
LILDGSDPDLKWTRQPVALNAMHGRKSIRAGYDDVGAHAVSERSAGAFLGETEADGSSFDGSADLVGDSHNQPLRALSPKRVHGAVAFKHTYLEKRFRADRYSG